MALKPKTFILRSPGVIDNLAEYIRGLVASGTLYEVMVRLHKEDRTLAQNRIYWQWVTILAGEQGLTKEEVHEDLKRRLLVPIYEKDPNNTQYAEMIQAVRKVHLSGMKAESEALARQIVKLTSTTTAKVGQFSEYLSEIEKDSANKMIFLPHPDDYHLALRGKDKEDMGR